MDLILRADLYKPICRFKAQSAVPSVYVRFRTQAHVCDIRVKKPRQARETE